MNKELLDEIRERGLLLEKEIYDLLGNFDSSNLAIDFLRNLEKFSGQKILTKSVLSRNISSIRAVMKDLPGGDKKMVENTFVKLGISLEIHKESKIIGEKQEAKEEIGFEIVSPDVSVGKKIEVADFTGNFRARYHELQGILMNRPELKNLVSINKISSDRRNLSIIGIITEKRITKNKNLMIKFEDLTGEIIGIVKCDREDVFNKAEELQLDDFVGVVASGNSEMLFVYDLFHPDSFVHEKIKFEKDISLAFVSDIHCGSKGHLRKEFEGFLNWLNSEDDDAKK